MHSAILMENCISTILLWIINRIIIICKLDKTAFCHDVVRKVEVVGSREAVLLTTDKYAQKEGLVKENYLSCRRENGGCYLRMT